MPAATAAGNGRPARCYRLEPHSGKTHQLRVHMASLGLGIVNDAFYPDLLDKAPDDYAKPLQLLARGIRFVDPITKQPVEYRSRLELSEAVQTRALNEYLDSEPPQFPGRTARTPPALAPLSRMRGDMEPGTASCAASATCRRAQP